MENLPGNPYEQTKSMTKEQFLSMKEEIKTKYQQEEMKKFTEMSSEERRDKWVQELYQKETEIKENKDVVLVMTDKVAKLLQEGSNKKNGEDIPKENMTMKRLDFEAQMQKQSLKKKYERFAIGRAIMGSGQKRMTTEQLRLFLTNSENKFAITQDLVNIERIKLNRPMYSDLPDWLKKVFPLESKVYYFTKMDNVYINAKHLSTLPIMDFVVPASPIAMMAVVPRSSYTRHDKTVFKQVKKLSNIIRHLDLIEHEALMKKGADPYVNTINVLRIGLLSKCESKSGLKVEFFEKEILPNIVLGKCEFVKIDVDNNVVYDTSTLDDEDIFTLANAMEHATKDEQMLAIDILCDHVMYINRECKFMQNIIKNNPENKFVKKMLDDKSLGATQIRVLAFKSIQNLYNSYKEEMKDLCKKYKYKANSRDAYKRNNLNLIPGKMKLEATKLLYRFSIGVINQLELSIIDIVAKITGEPKEKFQTYAGSKHITPLVEDMIHYTGSLTFNMNKNRIYHSELMFRMKAQLSKDAKSVDMKDVHEIIPQSGDKIPTRRELTIYVDWILDNPCETEGMDSVEAMFPAFTSKKELVGAIEEKELKELIMRSGPEDSNVLPVISSLKKKENVVDTKK